MGERSGRGCCQLDMMNDMGGGLHRAVPICCRTLTNVWGLLRPKLRVEYGGRRIQGIYGRKQHIT